MYKTTNYHFSLPFIGDNLIDIC